MSSLIIFGRPVIGTEVPEAIFASKSNRLRGNYRMLSKLMTLDRSFQQSPTMQTPQSKMLVAIDPGVETPQKLAAGVQPGAEVLILDPKRDGVEQIAQALKESADLASVHLISHGFPGGIKLGATELSLDNLDRYAGILQTWSKTLKGASLLLYGCQVALGEAGCRFVERLQQLTGANLAASTQKVGSAEKGGSWSLDYQIGQVIDELAFLPQVREAYSGVFVPEVSVTVADDTVAEGDSVTFNFTATGDPIPPGGIIISTNSIFGEGDQFDFNIDFGDPAYFNGIEYTDFVVTPEGEETILWTVTAPDASITLPIFDDSIAEPVDPFTLELFAGEGYTVDPDADSATVTISDEVVDGAGPTVSFSLAGPTADDLDFIESEGDTLTTTFTVNGVIPTGGLEVNVDADLAGALGDFALFDAEGDPLFESTGISGLPTNSTFDASGFSVVLVENTATISVEIFDDGPTEGLEEITFSLLNGENYEIDPEVNETTITIDDGDDGQFFGGAEDDVFEPGSVVEYNGSNDLVFAGAGDDLLDTSRAGSSRLYGQSGDDTFFLGNDDRAFGATGDDVFYALGEDSAITGGEGADAFWIASGEISGFNTVTDFELGTDVIGIGGLDLGFADLTFRQEGPGFNTIIIAEEEFVAQLTGITPDQLSASNFVFA